ATSLKVCSPRSTSRSASVRRAVARTQVSPIGGGWVQLSTVISTSPPCPKKEASVGRGTTRWNEPSSRHTASGSPGTRETSAPGGVVGAIAGGHGQRDSRPRVTGAPRVDAGHLPRGRGRPAHQQRPIGELHVGGVERDLERRRIEAGHAQAGEGHEIPWGGRR